MGVGLQQYHDAHRIFPPGMINCGGCGLGRDCPSYYPGQPFKVYNHTGFTLLLPFVGRGDLYARYDFTYPSCNYAHYYNGLAVADLGNGPDGTGTPGVSPGNAAVVGERVLTYECPSDHSPPRVDTNAESSRLGRIESVTNGRRGNYLFNALGNPDSSPSYFYSAGEPRGVFGINGAARLGELADGLGTTILVGETRQETCNPAFVPRWGAGCGGSVLGTAGSPEMHINFPAGANRLNDPNRARPIEDCADDEKHRPLQYWGGFGSWHPGGANFLFTDGSARFLADSMSYATFYRLNVINDTTLEGPDE